MDQSFSATWARDVKSSINKKPHPPYHLSQNQQIILETIAQIISTSEEEAIDFLLEIGVKYIKNNFKFSNLY